MVRARSGSQVGAGVAAVVVATIGFSTGFPIVKGIELPAATIAAWRLGLGVTVLGVAALLLRAPLPKRPGPIVAAGLAFGVHQLLFVEATKLTAIAIVTLVAAMQPLLVGLVSRRAVGEPVPRALVGWAVLAVSGVVLVAAATWGDDSRSLLGDLLAVANLAAFTTYFLAAKRARNAGAPALTFTVGFLGVAFLAILPIALLGDTIVPIRMLDASLLLVLALLPGNGHLLLTWAHSRVSAAMSSLVLAGIPVLASLWGRLFFDEPFGIYHVVGILAVVAAIEGGRRIEMRTGARLAAQAP